MMTTALWLLLAVGCSPLIMGASAPSDDGHIHLRRREAVTAAGAEARTRSAANWRMEALPSASARTAPRVDAQARSLGGGAMATSVAREKGARKVSWSSLPGCLLGVLLLLAVQGAVLLWWSAMQRLGGSGERGGINATEWAVQLRSDIFAAVNQQEQKLADMASDISSQLNAREAALISLATRLQEREQELASWQAKLSTPLQTGNDGKGPIVVPVLGGGESDLKASILEVGQRLQERERDLALLQNKLSQVLSKGGYGAGVAELSSGRIQDNSSRGAPCGRLQDTAQKGGLKWQPQPNKYMLLMCSGGQLSNRLSCIRQHMLDAALLNRTLIFPSHGVDYNYEYLLDLKQPEKCFGPNTFLTLDDYLSQKAGPKKVLRVNRFICHVHSYQGQRICRGLRTRYSQLGVTFGETEIPPLRTSGPWFKYTTKDFLGNFTYSDEVIAFGNMFGVGGRELRFEGSRPLSVSDSCRYYLTPSRAILETAVGFVNSFLGNRFMAFHLRRGDFFGHCMKGKAQGRHGAFVCFHPIQQVANCIVKRLEENPGINAIFLATNGNDQELQLLTQLLALHAKPVPLVRLPVLVDQPWAEPLTKQDLHNKTEVLALVEKTISVFGSQFYGTPGSTFSSDINRLRDWWHLKTCQDGNICSDSEEAEIRPVLPP